MTKSGCQLTWDYFFEDQKRPFFIDYIGDRDLWKWELPDSKEINAAIFETNLIDQNDLMKLTNLLTDSEKKIDDLLEKGKFILQLNKRELDIGAYNAIETKFNYEDKIYRIWLGGNISPSLRSDLGNLLCKKNFKDGTSPDFAATWQYDPKSDEWWVSLRGLIDKSPDLSVIASKYDGGGHYYASSIKINSPKGLKEIFLY